MAKARAIIKRRKSVQNIRKITRTMELIATARFKKAQDRATEASAFTKKIAELVSDLGEMSGGVSHPLLESRPVKNQLLLVVTSNRGLAGGYNGNVIRQGYRHYEEAVAEGQNFAFEVAGKRGIGYFRYRGMKPQAAYTQFEDKPQFREVEELANKYTQLYVSKAIDRFDVAYTKYLSSARQEAVVETLLPMSQGSLGTAAPGAGATGGGAERVPYEFLPDAASILEEIVPVSFKIRLFKCFLDAAVSEQIARMVAMRGATENADDMIKNLTRVYNRARQSQITRELSEIVAGAAALQ
jgi:F-type H+-transporting ATPase subunit gamma